MRKLLASVAIVALAACSPQPAEEPAATEVAATPDTAPAVTVANGSPPGDYEVVMPDGMVARTTINADGTYVDYRPDGSIAAEGAWAVTDGKTCFTPTTQGVEAMCFTDSAPAADGSFTATPDEGEAVTVRPAPPAAAEAAQGE